MTRLARHVDVLYWEEPLIVEEDEATVRLTSDPSGVTIATPLLPDHIAEARRPEVIRALFNRTLAGKPGPMVRWFYTPMMLPIAQHLNAAVTVYDCMDELSAFRFAPPELPRLESELMGLADIVFTGGYSLYEAKQRQHPNVHPFPSSVDVPHFAAARNVDCTGQPTIGFYGVIDERFDADLLAQVADLRPGIRFEVVGPTAKIDPARLPQRSNIAWLPAVEYADLPERLGRWHAAMMPFAINESTRFISPTKTPEYLAGGKPVISTPIRDVERHWGNVPGVIIASGAANFAAACDDALALAQQPEEWIGEVDRALARISWDRTFHEMHGHIQSRLVSSQSMASLRKRSKPRYDFLVVGAGFAGAVMAERLAADAGKRVMVIDTRPHIAGNAYDERNAAGLLVHRYGPHLFHTNSDDIFAYLSRFTEWRPYEHRVLADLGERGRVPMPINRTTLNLLFDAGLTCDEDASAFLAQRGEPCPAIETSEDVVVSAIGRELYEMFFRGYTRKQWGLDPSELDKSVTARVPVRTNCDDRYFTDRHQAMPLNGYTAMFERMLDHPLIDVLTGVSYAEACSLVQFDRLVWTGAIDEYFGTCFGKLPYRSLRFEHETLPVEQFQPVGTVNYPAESVPYTRITEFKHFTGEQAPVTSVVYEYPCAEGEPYYPVPRPQNQELFARYDRLARASDTIFVGRLATYRYYNMDQVVGQALATYRRLLPELGDRLTTSKVG
ncbi:UDP-galactopyranose mutase [Novosphingobium sp. TH158]|nr:UDP-galactopyranose mutase [Novosphingobium sp. TH158]